jgi:hypothetical protein
VKNRKGIYLLLLPLYRRERTLSLSPVPLAAMNSDIFFWSAVS